MITPDNVITVLISGAGISAILALVIAGQWQEMRFKRENKANIQQLNLHATNYARKQAQLATSANTIRKGHE